MTYLQTLFPRYVQASQEVVRIPKEVLARAKGAFLTMRIRATKKHKVRTAFLFTANPVDAAQEVVFTPLKVRRIYHEREKREVAHELAQQNQTFVHTQPGDTIAVEMHDARRRDGYKRQYQLKAHGFYTKMSPSLRTRLGDSWYKALDGESRKLLKNLRVYKS